MKLGFVGTGEITTAIVTGFSTAERPPEGILVSPRNAAKAAALAGKFPGVEVARSNQDVVDRSDWVVLAVLPQVAGEVLAALAFRPGQRIVSVIAGLPLAEVQALAAPAGPVVQAVPLPPVARRLGPVALCPPDAEAAALIARIGTPVEVATEAEMEAFWSVTALMAPYYALLGGTAGWLGRQGVPAAAAARYTASLFHALSVNARDAGPTDLEALTRDSQTKGGLNEQAYRHLAEAGWFERAAETLDRVLARLQGRLRYPS